jgi:large subunit ribosomal protein L30
MANTVVVKLVRSRFKGDKLQQLCLQGLNLRKINDTMELEDTPSVRGLIAKVQHLVAVEKV